MPNDLETVPLVGRTNPTSEPWTHCQFPRHLRNNFRSTHLGFLSTVAHRLRSEFHPFMDREHLQKLDVSWGREPPNMVGRGVLTAPWPGGLRTARPISRFMGRFLPSKSSRIEPLNLVGTARCAVRAAFSGATMLPADSRAGTSQRDVPTEVRFMGSRNEFRDSGAICEGTNERTPGN